MATFHFPPEAFPPDWLRSIKDIAKTHGGTVHVERWLLVFVRDVTVTVPDEAADAFARDIDALKAEIVAMQAIR